MKYVVLIITKQISAEKKDSVAAAMPKSFIKEISPLSTTLKEAIRKSPATILKIIFTIKAGMRKDS